MNLRTLTILALRLGGVYFALQAAIMLLPMLSALLQILRTSDPLNAYYWSIPLLFLKGALPALLLLFGSKRLAGYLVPTEEAPDQAPVDAQTLQTVGFALVGSLYALMGAQGILLQASRAVRYRPSSDLLELSALFADARPPQFAVPVFQVVAGVALVVGAKALSRWWVRVNS